MDFGRLRLPAFMDPKPIGWVAPDGCFKSRVDVEHDLLGRTALARLIGGNLVSDLDPPAGKTTLDWIGAAAGLVALSPLMIGVGLLVAIDSPGPVIYRRRVLGRSGKPFDAFYFGRAQRRDAAIG